MSEKLASPALDDYRWLIDEGAEMLGQVAASSQPTIQIAAKLRETLSAQRTRLVLEQVELRRRARHKFDRADTMFFTPRGLQQATDQWLAAYKARRFPRGLPVADLCCGIGGDLLSLAGQTRAAGIDKDAVIVLLAATNLRSHQLASGSVRCLDVRDVDLGEFAAWHFDPDRRPGEKRRSQPELYQPPLDEFLVRRRAPHGAIKLSPAANVQHPWLAGAELEWIGHRRECQQLVAWFGDLARYPDHRVATVLAPANTIDSAFPRQIVGQADTEVEIAYGVESYLFEPQPSVLAAKLDGTLAAEHGLRRIAPGIGYFTGDDFVGDRALSSFRVLEVLPYRPKRLKQLLRQRQAGKLEVKKRGVALDPDTVRRTLAVPGDNQLTLILVPIRQSITAVLAHRVAV